MKKEKGMEGTTLKPIMTEKAVMMIEKDNTLIFQTSSKKEKKDLKWQKTNYDSLHCWDQATCKKVKQNWWWW